MLLLEDVIKEFIYDAELRGLSHRTIKSYTNNNLRFFRFLENEFQMIELKKLNSKHIKMYLSLLKRQGLSESYINNILKNIRAFLTYCTKEDYIIDNPSEKVEFVKEPQRLIKTFTDNEVIKMLKVLPNSNFLNIRNNAILVTFIETGIRNTELCSIKADDIKARSIVIQGKGNKERVVPLTKSLKKYLIRYDRVKESYFTDKFPEDYYFLSRTGRQLTAESNERIIANFGELASVRNEIRCSPHTLRHYYAQSQLKNGLDVYSLSRLLGHTNISVTKRYLESLEDDDLIDMASDTSVLANLKGVRR